MKIKRFLAPDIRQALQQVKETLGAEAVILSNRKTDQGVEIIAACDFDLETVASANPLPPSPGGRGVREERGTLKPESAGAEPVQPLNTKPEPVAKLASKPKVVPKPAFSARGYSAVAEFAGTLGQSRGEVKKPKPVVATQPGRMPAASAAGDPRQSDMFASLQRELQQMRRLLDQHLSRETWREEGRESPTRLDLLRILSELGFARHFAVELARLVAAHEDITSALHRVRQFLIERMPVLDDCLLDGGGVVALVGPTGVGKTTTIAKLAARFRLEHGPRQIALVTLDNYRIAAYEQLSTYARILGVPIRGASDPQGLKVILRGFADKRLVLVDTAGMSPRDLRLAEQLALLRDGEMSVSTYLVLAANTQLPSLYEAIDAFSGCRPKAAILTKVDETGCLGPALSALVERELPAAFFTDGQQVPEDLHRARAETLIQRCFETALTVSFPAEMGFDFEDWVTHVSA